MDATAALSSRALIPFNFKEAVSVKEAASIAGRSQRTIRRWTMEFGIGRRIAGGNWAVSRVALAMILDGDHDALIGYCNGARAQFEPVARHFQKVGLGELLTLPEFGAGPASR